jgi:hypothetical protein
MLWPATVTFPPVESPPPALDVDDVPFDEPHAAAMLQIIASAATAAAVRRVLRRGDD